MRDDPNFYNYFQCVLGQRLRKGLTIHIVQAGFELTVAQAGLKFKSSPPVSAS